MTLGPQGISGKFERMGPRRIAWCRKAELSGSVRVELGLVDEAVVNGVEG
jgi:hypothetical protein